MKACAIVGLDGGGNFDLRKNRRVISMTQANNLCTLTFSFEVSAAGNVKALATAQHQVGDVGATASCRITSTSPLTIEVATLNWIAGTAQANRRPFSLDLEVLV